MKPRVEPGGGGSWIPTAEMALASATPSTTPATAPSTPSTKPSSTNIDTTPRRRVPSAMTVPISRVRSKMAMVMVLVMPNTTMMETISEHREDAAEELAHLVVAQRQVLPRLDLEVEAPVADQPLEALADGGGVVRRVQEQRDRLHLAGLEVEDALGLGQADPEEAIVVRLLARLPDAPHLDGQRVDRARLGGGEQGEVVARLHAEGPGEPDAEGDAARIARRQVLAVDDYRQRREIHLALGYDAGADERRRGVAGGDEPGEAEARGDHLDVLDPPQLVAQRRVVGDQVVERREVALLGVAPAIDLDVADLAADGGLANAVIDGVHEAAEHDDGGGPEAHRGQRDQRAAPVAEDVAESQLRIERHGYRLLNSLSIAAASGAAG